MSDEPLRLLPEGSYTDMKVPKWSRFDRVKIHGKEGTIIGSLQRLDGRMISLMETDSGVVLWCYEDKFESTVKIVEKYEAVDTVIEHTIEGSTKAVTVRTSMVPR